MNILRSPLTRFTLALQLAAAAAFIPLGFAAEAKSPPLKLQLDTKPINRDAADRVSYAPILERAAHSIVDVYSPKRVRRQDLAPLLPDPMFRRFFSGPVSHRQARRLAPTGVISPLLLP